MLAAFEALSRIGLWIIAGAFLVIPAAKWWQRELFIWQLRMDRLTVRSWTSSSAQTSAAKVIDVRSPMSQAMTGRIPGAITVDPKNIRVELLAVEPDGEVIVYCACPNEYTAAKVAKVLKQHGFKRVRPLEGGIDAWIAAGHPVEKVEPAGAKVVPIKVQRTGTRRMAKEAIHADATTRPPRSAPTRRRSARVTRSICPGRSRLDPKTMALVEGGIEAQAHQVFRNLRAVMAGAAARSTTS